MLDYIDRQLQQLRIVQDLPENSVSPDVLVNRAMDVRSASMNYVAVHIHHESQTYGTAGKPTVL